jgi:hypothetical protein
MPLGQNNLWVEALRLRLGKAPQQRPPGTRSTFFSQKLRVTLLAYVGDLFAIGDKISVVECWKLLEHTFVFRAPGAFFLAASISLSKSTKSGKEAFEVLLDQSQYVTFVQQEFCRLTGRERPTSKSQVPAISFPQTESSKPGRSMRK